MGLVDMVIAAADATKGTNLFDGHWAEEDTLRRRIVRVGLVGSSIADAFATSATGSFSIDIYYGKLLVAKDLCINREAAAATGTHCLDDDMPVGGGIYPGVVTEKYGGRGAEYVVPEEELSDGYDGSGS